MQDPKKEVSLQDFPKILRHVALVLLDSEHPISLKEACRIAGVNYDVVRVYITRYKKKGKDFWHLCNKENIEKLRESVCRVDRAIVNRAVAGSAKHAELFYRRLGLWKEQVEHKHAHQHLHFSAPLPLWEPDDK